MLEIISVYLGIFILGIGEIIFAKTVLDKNIQVSKFKFSLLFFISTIFYFLIFTFVVGLLKSILLFVIHMLIFRIIFNLYYNKAIFLSFLHSIMLLAVDLLIVFIFTNILGMSNSYFLKNIAGGIICNFTTCLLFVFLTFVLRKPLKLLINNEINYNVKLVGLLLLTFCSIAMFFCIFIKKFRTDENSLVYLIVIFVLIFILFSLIKQTIENNKLMKEYDKLLEFMTTYENEIEKQRVLRHETKNEFLAIKAKICDKQKNKEIIEYIDEILKDKIIVNQEKYAKFGYLPANGIKGLCYFKVQEAENLGIDVSINISSRIKKSSIFNLNIKNQRDLGKLLGVFLDNAIEASLISKTKQLGIEIYVNNKKETVVIISNTFNNVINKTIIGKERFTTKGKNRGHGLLLVKHILEKNNIFEGKNEIVNEIYIQTIIIKSK